MRADSASDTARLVARSLLLASKDPNLSRLVPPDEPAFLAQILETAGGHRLFEFTSSNFLSRKFLFGIEQFLLPGIITHYLARKRRIEVEVRKAIEEGIKNVTIIGAGFDSLAWRLQKEFPEISFLELDHPATQKIKREALGENSVLQFSTIDLSKPDADQHFSKLKIDSPGVVVAEGLTMYLTEERISALLRNAASIAGPDGSLIFTFMNANRETGYGFHNESKLIARWLKKRNEPFLWGMLKDELPAFLENQGLSTLGILDHHDLDREILTPRNLQGITIAQGECLCIAQIAPA